MMSERYAILRTEYREQIPYYTVIDSAGGLVIATTNERIAKSHFELCCMGYNSRQIWYLNQYIRKAPLRRY